MYDPKKLQNSYKSSLKNRFNVYLTNRSTCETDIPNIETKTSYKNQKNESLLFTSFQNEQQYMKPTSNKADKNTKIQRYSKHIKFLQKNLVERQHQLEQKNKHIKTLNNRQNKLKDKINRYRQSNHKLKLIINQSSSKIQEIGRNTQNKDLIQDIQQIQKQLSKCKQTNIDNDDPDNDSWADKCTQNQQNYDQEITFIQENKEDKQLKNQESTLTVKKYADYIGSSNQDIPEISTKILNCMGIQTEDFISNQKPMKADKKQQDTKQLQKAIYYLKKKNQQLQNLKQNLESQFNQQKSALVSKINSLQHENKELQDINANLTDKMQIMQQNNIEQNQNIEKICSLIEKPIEQLMFISRIGINMREQQKNTQIAHKIQKMQSRIRDNQEQIKKYSAEQHERLMALQQKTQIINKNVQNRSCNQQQQSIK